MLAHLAIKSYDLVLSRDRREPGGAAELPSTFMYSYTFTRNQMAVGSASAMIMLMAIAGDHGALSLFRIAGEEPMSAADAIVPAPGRDPCAPDPDARGDLWAAAASSRSSISCRCS